MGEFCFFISLKLIQATLKRKKVFQLPKMPLPFFAHSKALRFFFIFEGENDTKIIWRTKKLPNLPRNFPYHHHKKEGKIFDRKEDEGKMWKVEHNKKIFLLISFMLWLIFFNSPSYSSSLKGCQKQAFLLTPTQATHFGWEDARKRKNIKPFKWNNKPYCLSWNVRYSAIVVVCVY